MSYGKRGRGKETKEKKGKPPMFSARGRRRAVSARGPKRKKKELLGRKRLQGGESIRREEKAVPTACCSKEKKGGSLVPYSDHFQKKKGKNIEMKACIAVKKRDRKGSPSSLALEGKNPFSVSVQGEKSIPKRKGKKKQEN